MNTFTKIIYLLCWVIAATTASAQKDSLKTDELRTVFGKVKSHGGYGAVMYRYGIINERNAYINGGRGGWVINHHFTIGGYGVGFRTESEYDAILAGNYKLTGGYGGILLEPILYPKHAFHVAIPFLIGAGGVSYSAQTTNQGVQNEEVKAFFVIEPGVEVELSLFKFLRAGLGAYYRYTSPIELQYVSGDPIDQISSMALTNWSIGVTFKFGKF